MNINMNNIMLSKENNGWIYINEMVKGVKTPTTKLLYDDNAFANPAVVYKQELLKLENNNFAVV